MGAAAPKPLLAHSSRQQADGYSGNANKLSEANFPVFIMDYKLEFMSLNFEIGKFPL